MRNYLKDVYAGAFKAVMFSVFASVLAILHLLDPFLFLWSLNTLFHCEIEYTIKTLVAAFLLIAILRHNTKKEKE